MTSPFFQSQTLPFSLIMLSRTVEALTILVLTLGRVAASPAASARSLADTLDQSRSNAISKVLIAQPWVWIPVGGTKCSDGSTTGFALNLNAFSTDLVINFEGGGICADYDSCYVSKLAYNMGTPFNGSTFASQKIADSLTWYGPTIRSTSANPFYQSSYACIPYCTGDLHAGDSTVTYAPNKTPTYHDGFNNRKLILQTIKFLLPLVQTIRMTGSSAGGFGAIFQYPNAVAIFGSNKRIDLIADSAVDSSSALFFPSQRIVAPSKNFCPTCDNSNFDSFMPGFAAVRPNSRFAALSYSDDNVLPAYEATSSAALNAEIVSSFTTLNKLTNAKGFIATSSGHSVLTNPGNPAINGLYLADYLTNMVKASDSNWKVGM